MTQGVIVSKNVAVFVDVANIFYAAKAAGVDIDYVTLLKATTAGRDFVRAYAYTGLDPENENQRNFHSFLARHGYKVVSKDIRKYGDGKVKANLDIELVVDMMKTARNLDIAVVISGDGDFAPAIRAVQEMGVRVEVVSFRGNTSSDLIDVADIFMDITQIAKVEKGSSRSGRRVADDEEDLSMTEVPEKQTEGTGRRRGRGGRGRTAEPVVVSAAGRDGRGSRPKPVLLPGERLSKLGAGEPADAIEAEEPEEAEEAVVAAAAAEGVADTDEAGPRRRRRRRGGRGRGRGRGAEGAETGEAGVEADEGEVEEAGTIVPVPVAPGRPRPTPFGSVWDSQIGMPSAPASGAGTPATSEEEDFEEPEIPEYLIAERNRARAGRPGAGRGPRAGRSAYAAALDRERFGGGRSSTLNRYPDVSGRTGGGRPEPARRPEPGRRPERQERPERRDRSAEPWSEVPPEIEELLRAQMAARPASAEPAAPAEAAAPTAAVRPARGGRRARPAGAAATGPAPEGGATTAGEPVSAGPEGGAGSDMGAPAPEEAAPRRRRTRRPSAGTPEAAGTTDGGAGSEPVASEPPKRRTRRPAPSQAPAEPVAESAAEAPASEGPTPAPRRRTSRKASEAATPVADEAVNGTGPATEAPKRRTRKTTASAG
jgi:uncharacterized LabA/DUF88 family protein